MIEHPPWLRFHAYSVGLPKTGSSSLAAVFGRYRTRHEWAMLELIEWGTARRSGEITDEEFWRRAGGRLVPPVLEFDVATSHHLYADALAERFEHARFIHVVRDARSWVNSMLDMGWRMRRARVRLGIAAEDWQIASAFYADVAIAVEDDAHTDAAMVPALLRAWQRHLDDMARVLPADRTLTIRLPDLSSSWDEVAAFLGVDPSTLARESDRARVAPVRFDRLLVDPAAAEQAYSESAAQGMAMLFPDEHSALLRDLQGTEPVGDWAAYSADVERWVDEMLPVFGAAIAH